MKRCDENLVSIIIPTFNRSSVLYHTLTSIQNQNYTNWECLLIDDGSTDNTLEVIQPFLNNDKRFQYHKRPIKYKAGGNGARNFGYDISKGKYIQWFDSDDIMHKNKLEYKVKILAQKDVDFVVCCGYIVDMNMKILDKWDSIINKNPCLMHIYGSIALSTNGPMFKKSFLEKFNRFDERLKRKQEWEYFSRLLCHSENYYALNKYLFYYKQTPDSINAKNQVKSVYSKVLANILVYKNVRKFKKNLVNDQFRKHFFNKLIHNLKFSVKNKQYKAMLYSIYGLFLVHNIPMIKNYLKKGKYARR